MKEGCDQTRQIHKEVIKILAGFHELLIERFQWNSTRIGARQSEKVSSDLVSKPNLYFSHEYKSPPESRHVVYTLEPQFLTSHQFCTSINCVPLVFDKSLIGEYVVKPVAPSCSVTTASQYNYSIVSVFQCFDRICEVNSYVLVLPIFGGNDPRKWILKARIISNLKVKLM